MKFHQFSEIFPLIEGAALEELTADIKANGLREKIWTYQNKILDGRNRFIACKKAGIEPAYRKYTGKDPLSFVVSLNVQRRHMTESQRAMAAAEIAKLSQGQKKADAQICASSQSDAAEKMSVSRRSVQHAKKVVDEGSAALKRAVKTGEIAVSKAASVVDLPKSEQLAAAQSKKPASDEEPERPEWEPDEDEKLAAIEREIAESTERVMRANDKLAAAHVEIKRQAAEIAGLKSSRDHYQSETGAAVRLVKARDRQIEKLERELAKVKAENESLQERIAIMEAA